jgi:predicted PurR-regulated permease PerM
MAEPVETPSHDSRASKVPATPLAVRQGMEIGLRIVAVVAAGLLLWWTAQVLLVLFAAVFLSVFFHGVAMSLHRRSSFSYPFWLAFSLLTLFFVFAVAGLLVGPAVADQAGNLSRELPKAAAKVMGDVRSWPGGNSAMDGLQQALKNSRDGNSQSLIKFAGLTLHGFGGALFAVVIAIFFAAQPDLYRNGFLALFPKARRARMTEVLNELGFTLWWWLMGQLATMASVGILVGIGLTLLGVKLSGTLGLLAAILSFIPSLGPAISVVPALMMGLTISPTMAIWVALLYAGVQTLEANVITPLIQRRAISLPPAFVLGSELLMGLLLGGAGLAFATPLAAVILVLVNMLYIQDRLKDKGSLPSDDRHRKRRKKRDVET